MRYLAAYALAFLAGKANPSAADVKKIVESAGAEVDDSKIAAICDALQGKEVSELVAEKLASMANVPTGAAVAATSGPGEAAAEAAPVEEEEEEEDDFGFDLFG